MSSNVSRGMTLLEALFVFSSSSGGDGGGGDGGGYSSSSSSSSFASFIIIKYAAIYFSFLLFKYLWFSSSLCQPPHL